MKWFLLTLLAAMPFWLHDCLGSHSDSDREPLVQVEGETLFRDEVQELIPSGLSAEDSLKLAEKIVHDWIKETLVFHAASQNMKESGEINRMVEAYRRSLIVYRYKQMAMNEKLEESVTPEDISAYYEAHSQQFLSPSHLVKGVFIKMPLHSASLTKVKNLYQNKDDESLRRLETLCLKQALAFEDFTGHWMSLEDVMDQIPYNMKDPRQFLKNNPHLETSDDNAVYFLCIRDYLLQGQPEPLEYVSARIQNILVNSQKSQFLEQYENEMVSQAEAKGRILYFQASGDSQTSPDHE